MSNESNSPAEQSRNESSFKHQGNDDFSRLEGDLSSEDFVIEQQQATNGVRTGMTEPAPSWVKVGATIAILIFVSGLLVWLAGQWQQGRIQQYLSAQTALPPPFTTIVDTLGSRALLLEEMGDYRRVLVQEAGNPKLILISSGDLSVRNPGFSPDGKWVAYISTSQESVVWTSLLTNTQESISKRDLDTVASGLTICDWTQVAWSPASDRIAVFACNANSNQSMVIWFEIVSPMPASINASTAQAQPQRDLAWLTQNEVLVTTANPQQPGGNRLEQYFAQ